MSKTTDSNIFLKKDLLLNSPSELSVKVKETDKFSIFLVSELETTVNAASVTSQRCLLACAMIIFWRGAGMRNIFKKIVCRA